MRDPITAVSDAYTTALDVLTVDGIEAPFYTLVPESANRPYTYIESIRADEDGDKSNFGHTVDVTVLVVTDSHTRHGRVSDSEDLANSVMNTIKTNLNTILSLANFTMINTRMTGTMLRRETEKSKDSINREINFRHIVEQTS